MKLNFINYLNPKHPVALFFALNIIFSVYLLVIDVTTAILLALFSIIIFYLYKKRDTTKILKISGLEIHADIFEKLTSLVPFSTRIVDLQGKHLLGNNSKINSTLGAVISQVNLKDCKIIRVKISHQIYTLLSYTSNILDDKRQVVGHLIVEFIINDILSFLGNEILKGTGNSEKKLVAFDNINDALAVYELNLGSCDPQNEDCKIGKLCSASPSFYNLFAPNGADSAFLDLFDVSERKRVNIILEGLDKTPTLFESLMVNEGGIFPVEINANSFAVDDKNLLSVSVRDISARKESIAKRDRSRILKVKETERIQKIQVLRLVLTKASETIVQLKSALQEVINRHNNVRDEIRAAADLSDGIKDQINEIIHFYSQSDLKMVVVIRELIDEIKRVIFIKTLLNNVEINFTQQGSISGIYCDKNALKIVLVTLLGNSLEQINIAKGSNFYGRIEVNLSELNDECVLLSIEDNGGGIDGEFLSRAFDLFYTTREGRAGLGLTACKILVEDLLFGEIMAMNVEDGFRVEIMLPKEGIRGGGESVSSIAAYS